MATRNWSAGGADNKATTAGNWDTPPVSGDSVVVGFDSRGIVWDINPAVVLLADVTFQGNAGATGGMTITLGINSQSTGAFIIKSLHATNTVTLATSTYTLQCGALTLDTRGCLSQTGTGGNVTCTSYTQSGTGSVLTGKVDATFTCSGDFIHTVGSNAGNLKLIMSGTNNILSTSATFNTLTISGKITTNGASGTFNLYTTASGNFIIGSVNFYYYSYAGSVIQNLGRISGSTNFLIIFLNAADRSESLGIITSPLLFRASAASAGNRVFTAISKLSAGGFAVDSLHVSNTMAVDLNGYDLSCNGITVGTRGILLGKTGKIENCGNTDMSAGTWTPGTSTFINCGAARTIKLAAGQAFYNLISKVGITTLLSNVIISNVYAHVNPVVLGAYTLTLTDPSKEYVADGRRPMVSRIVGVPIHGAWLTDEWLNYLEGIL